MSERKLATIRRIAEINEIEGNAFWQVARNHDLENKLQKLGYSIAIQGELMGPGVQGNKENLTELDLYVFDMWDIDNQRYFYSEERRIICDALGLKHAPVIDTNFNLGDMKVIDILEMADGPSLNAKLRKGLVFKSMKDPSVSWKAISNKWLLKTGE